MKRIVVYKSSTGFTEKYAKWIADELGCEAIPLKKTKMDELKQYDQIIYGGWIMANMVMGYNKISEQQLNNVVVFGVGMSVPGEEVIGKIAEQNKLQREKFFYFEGGYNPKKVGFFKKLMMSMIRKSIEKKVDKTPEDIHMLDTFKGADNTNKDAIKPLLDYVLEA